MKMDLSLLRYYNEINIHTVLILVDPIWQFSFNRQYFYLPRKLEDVSHTRFTVLSQALVF